MGDLFTANLWSYRPIDVAGIVELGTWDGIAAPDLRPHFHDETQIAMVLVGSRAFRIAGSTVTVTAGKAISIPAGLVHAPLTTSDCETVCVNIYLEADHTGSSLQLFDVQRAQPRALEIALEKVAAAESDPALKRRRNLQATLTRRRERIGEIAATCGRSRESFSRRAARELGVGPHAFRILSRLNRARRLLREGRPLAEIAAETGFSDQSHLTRLFRRAFGTTPARYWRG